MSLRQGPAGQAVRVGRDRAELLRLLRAHPGAWKTAGVTLPRTTLDQVNVGAKVAKSQMKPGDLVFFYDDISHVGIYIGNGQMIHAPKPGADVRYESIDNMPFHSANRPG